MNNRAAEPTPLRRVPVSAPMRAGACAWAEDAAAPGCSQTACSGDPRGRGAQDTEVFYDLKRLLEDSNANIPPQLARHEASKNKPGSVTDKPKREQITYAA
jgi:hypothetical protein